MTELSYQAVKDSSLFDEEYYLQRYPDVAKAGDDPLLHFMAHGAFEGRDPNPWFKTKWYVWQYPDIGRNGDNPLVHYLAHGAFEGRDPSPWFDTVAYLVDHPELVEGAVNPLAHFIAQNPTKRPDSVQADLLQQDNSGRAVRHPELTDLIDFPPRPLCPASSAYDPKCLDIHWIAPDFAPGGGGSMTMFRMVRLLEEFGHRCTIWIVRPNLNKNERSASEVALRHYQTIRAEIRFIDSAFFKTSGDALICTSWETVILGMHATGFKDRFYFVQDYEPSFFAKGSRSLAAEWTYKSDVACICVSPWLAETLKSKYGRWVRFGWLAADLQTYFPGKPHAGRAVPTIAFYARRYTERRAVDLGLLALEQLARSGTQFHVQFFGMKLDIQNLPYPATDNGILTEAELAQLYRRSDVGIVFSSTNYSLVPQEMMASGLAVVELDSESTRRIFPPDIITLAGPHPLDIAQKIHDLLHDRARRVEQSHKALNWVRQFKWEDLARTVETSIIERLAEKKFSAVETISSPTIVGQKPKVSIFIPTLNGGSTFKTVLRAVEEQKAPWPFEVIIIDSDSSDGTAEFAKGHSSVFQTISQTTFQHGRTRNLGIEMASGEYVAMLTQDALPTSNRWLYDMIVTLEKYPHAAGAFGRHIAYPDASPFLKRDIASHFAGFDAYPIAVSKFTHFRNWSSGDIGWRQMLHFFSDNNSCIRKSIWNKIPYPNIEFGEDQVWAMRTIEAGYEKVYVKSAAVYHSHNYAADELSRQSEQEGRFFKKYFGYDCVPLDYEMVRDHIETVNKGEEKWANQNKIEAHSLAERKQLNASKILGLWLGMISTDFVGYERDPLQ